MDKFIIEGGVSLRGEVAISGAKNAALPIMAACLLAEGECRILDVPPLADVATLSQLLGELGMDVSREGNDLRLRVVDTAHSHACYDLVRKMRASVCVLGPLLASRGYARVAMPGGCTIGPRPIDIHLRGLRALGAEIELQEGDVVARADRLKGAEIFLGGPFGSTVTGTANVMMAATLAQGRTIIECAACEPEVQDLADFLNAMGARIRGAGTPRLTIEGVRRLEGAEHRIIPDRIEAGTFMIAAAMAGEQVQLARARLDHMMAVVDKLRQIGLTIEPSDGGAVVVGRAKLRAVEVCTHPYPGFPTDLQAQLMALLCAAEGNSVITEKVFPDRFLHVAELGRMGANIRKEGPTSIVTGVERLVGAPVMASDLRASAALVLAGLVAKGTSEVSRVYHIDRGYDRIEAKLAHLGANIHRVKA